MPRKPQRAGSALNPERIHQISFSFAPSRVLTSGLELRVFSHIASGKKTADAIARAARCNRRGMRMLLDALAALELLTKTPTSAGSNKEPQYGLSPLAAQFLVRERPDYVGAMMELADFSDPWLNLTKSVRTGKPIRNVEDEKKGARFFPILVKGLHVINRMPARRAAEALGIGGSHKGLSIIDIACGSGVWGIAAAEADPAARITAQDFPGMLRETKKYLKRHGVEDRYAYLPGDLNKVDFGKGHYDVAILGNIVHSEGERNSRRLFRRLYRALRPGGRVAIVDMIPNDARSGPLFPIFFALNMLLNTAQGDTYTVAEYAEWLLDAGFERVETADIGSHSPLIIGYKK